MLAHLAERDLTLICVSRAPLEKLEASKERMGWSVPWVSSGPSDFNTDFGVSFEKDALAAGVDYNFARIEGDPRYMETELPGMSAFALVDDVVFHAYSAYARGLDALCGVYQWLDRAPKGRNEADDPGWLRRHDEYETTPSG